MSIKGLVKQFTSALQNKLPPERVSAVVKRNGANLIVKFEKRTNEDEVIIHDKLFLDISNAMLELAYELNLCLRRSSNRRDSLTYTFEAV